MMVCVCVCEGDDKLNPDWQNKYWLLKRKGKDFL